MIQVTDLSFSYGEKPLYEKVNFVIGKGQKVGLVGPNGSGKSTLLSILTGKEDGYSGRVKILGNVCLVPQEIKNDPTLEKANTAYEYVDPENKMKEYEIYKLFSGLELKVKLQDNPSKFSGGQKTKLALARALSLNPDVLVLDEPTNFMDTAGKKWVMDFLAGYKGSVLVISHDLELMDRAIDKVLVITPYDSRIREYTGTYSDYLRLKAQDDTRIKKEREIQERYVKRLEIDYAKKAQFDATKSILRRKIERERLALPEIPKELKNIKVNLPEIKNVGEIPIKAIQISKAYGQLEVLKNLNFTIIRGERIALIGPNGAGKSTFIKILMAMVEPNSGVIQKDKDLVVGYYSQEFETFDFSKTVIKTFCEATNRPENFARAFLGRFLFSNVKVFQRIETLSGGEKTRLAIAILTAGENNLLILDEPTTYLDAMSQRIILETLKKYQGTMIIVSHTPEFLKELKIDKAFLFPEEKMVYWDEYLLDKVAEI